MNATPGQGSCSPRWPRTARAGLLRNLVLLVLSISLTSCLGLPVKAPRVKTPTSETIKGKVDLTFLQVGVTTRAEVRASLGHLAAGYEAPNVFVARWLDSEWMFLWAAGAYYTGAMGASRDWGAHTLFIEFDDRGVVRAVEAVADKQLVAALEKRLKASPQHGVGEKFIVNLMHSHTWSMAQPGVLTLGAEGVELREEGKKKHDFLTPLSNVESLRFHGIYAVGPDPRPNEFLVSVGFREKTPGGKFLLFHIDFPQLVALVRVAHAYGLKLE